MRGRLAITFSALIAASACAGTSERCEVDPQRGDIQAIERSLDELINGERPLVDGRETVAPDSLREARSAPFIFEGEVIHEAGPPIRLFSYRNPKTPRVGYLVSRDERSPCFREVSWRITAASNGQ